MRVINFMAGFLGGIVIGAAIVLLTTPQSGNEFQTGVQARFGSILDEGRRAAAARRAELEARFATLRGS